MLTGKEESERSKELEDARLVALSNSSLLSLSTRGHRTGGRGTRMYLANASEDMKVLKVFRGDGWLSDILQTGQSSEKSSERCCHCRHGVVQGKLRNARGRTTAVSSQPQEFETFNTHRPYTYLQIICTIIKTKDDPLNELVVQGCSDLFQPRRPKSSHRGRLKVMFAQSDVFGWRCEWVMIRDDPGTNDSGHKLQIWKQASFRSGQGLATINVFYAFSAFSMRQFWLFSTNIAVASVLSPNLIANLFAELPRQNELLNWPPNGSNNDPAISDPFVP